MSAKISSPSSATPRAPKTMKEGFLARLLDPLDRLVEAIYSVLIVLTFTLATRAVQSNSGSVQLEGWDTVTQLFWAAIGCAVAWGLIDGAMYILTCVFERGQDRRLYLMLRNAASPQVGAAILADELDDRVGAIATPEERSQAAAALYDRLSAAPPPNVGFEKADFAGGLGTLLVAVGAALPVVLPLVILPGSVDFRLRAVEYRREYHALWHGLSLGPVCRRQAAAFRPATAGPGHSHGGGCHSVRRLVCASSSPTPLP